MGWTAFLLSYLLGGLTFLPLVVAAVLLHAYLTFPYREDVAPSRDDAQEDDSPVRSGDDLKPLKAAQAQAQAPQKEGQTSHAHQEPDVAAGYFAVCREYTPMGINAKPIERSTPVGSATVAAPSPSVYQTMYRSIFDRKQAPGPLDHSKNNANQRPKKAGNVFYVVLRHGHLMLFDDDEQLEVRHVISLAHHDIGIYSGGDVTPEGELFIKRNALCLSRKTDGGGGDHMAPDAQVTKPFYLFSENCSAKEDFYFALLRNQGQTLPREAAAAHPRQFDVKNIISLVQKLHSSEEHLQTRWLNAMIGRIFLGIHQTKDLEALIRAKITKKISRVKTPSFLSSIVIRKIDTGESAPYLSNPRLRDLTVEGECGVEADVRYTGHFRIEVAAKARIDLGSRFKVREVDLVLAVMVRRVEGHALFRIKPPPSNRVWFSFQQMPKVDMAIEPIVSSRQITYTVILRQIEHRIKEIIAESVVLPFWDDVPFFRTEHKRWRGGIFAGDDYVEPSAELELAAAQTGDVDDVDRLEEGSGGAVAAAAAAAEPELLPTMEKSHSVPVLETTAPTSFFSRKLNKGLGSPKPSVSSSSSTGFETRNGNASPSHTHPHPAPSPAPPGSPSLANNSSSSGPTAVGTDVRNADACKPEHASAASAVPILSARPGGDSPSPAVTPAGSPARPSALSNASSHSSLSSSKEATDNERDSEVTPRPQGASSSQDEGAAAEDDTASSTMSVPASTKGSSRSQAAGSLTRNLFLRRDNNNNHTTGSNGSGGAGGGGGGGADPQKRTTLAAVSNAAGAAKRWGLNALQRHNDGGGGSSSRISGSGSGSGSGELDASSQVDLSQPMGRGQPLPPPGVPLPGPGRRSKTGSTPVPQRRKPVPPPHAPPLPERRSTAATEAADPKGGRRPVPPPPLPRRRQISHSEPDSDHDNMLVVAAPADSAPGSPSAEEPPPPYGQQQPRGGVESEGKGEEGGQDGDQTERHSHLAAEPHSHELQHHETLPSDQEGDVRGEKDELEDTTIPNPREKDERHMLEEDLEQQQQQKTPFSPVDQHDEEKAAWQEQQRQQRQQQHMPEAEDPLGLHGRQQDHHGNAARAGEEDDDEDVSAWMDDAAEQAMAPTPAEALVTSEGMAAL